MLQQIELKLLCFTFLTRKQPRLHAERAQCRQQSKKRLIFSCSTMCLKENGDNWNKNVQQQLSESATLKKRHGWIFLIVICSISFECRFRYSFVTQCSNLGKPFTQIKTQTTTCRTHWTIEGSRYFKRWGNKVKMTWKYYDCECVSTVLTVFSRTLMLGILTHFWWWSHNIFKQFDFTGFHSKCSADFCHSRIPVLSRKVLFAVMSSRS